MSSEQRKLYRMPDTDAAILRNLAKVSNNESLPQGLVDMYWGYRAVCSKASVTTIPVYMLCWIAFCAGVGLEPPPPPTLMDQWKEGTITKKTPLEFKYRGDEWRQGTAESFDYAKRHFVIRGHDGMRYEIRAENVRIPEPVTAE